MLLQKQAFMHRPDEGIFGDCQRTCYANMLDLDRDSVPNFGIHYGDGLAFNKAVDEWLASQGYCRLIMAFADNLSTVLKTMKNLNPGVFYLLAGTSKNDCNHIVIALDDQIYWDTSINDSGIVGRCDDGFHWIEVLLPAKFKLNQ